MKNDVILWLCLSSILFCLIILIIKAIYLTFSWLVSLGMPYFLSGILAVMGLAIVSMLIARKLME